MYLIVWIQNSRLTNKVFAHLLASCNNVSLCSVSRAQPGLYFGVGNCHEISFDDVIVLQLFRKPSQIKFSSQHFRIWELFGFNQDADRTMRTE